jgi:hypothetical protein
MHFDYVTFIIPEEHGCLSHSVLSSVLPPW